MLKKIVPNRIKKTESLEIIKNKKKLCDQEVQCIPQDNVIETQEIEIIRNKKKTKDSSCQYITKRPIICKSSSYNILMSKKKELKPKYKINKNRITIVQNKKKVIEKGQQCDILKNYRSKEMIIGNNFSRGNTQKFFEIFEKIRKKKEKIKFMKNCKMAEKETMIKRVLLRLALLKWRFIKGYGGDRYGIIYDRNGNVIGRKEGLVNDVSIQNNLDEDINKQNLRNKQLKIKVSKLKPLFIKSNIVYKPRIITEVGTGDEPNHIIDTKIDKITSLSYKRKYKPINKISKNSFRINKTLKKVKDQGTSMKTPTNKIEKGTPILYFKDTNLKNIHIRRRDLLTQIISKNIIREKYIVNKYFSKWHTKTVRIMRYENQKSVFKKVRPRIIKNEKFEILPKTLKRDKSCGFTFTPQIVRGSKIEYKNSITKKDVGIIANMPNRFKLEKLRTRKISNDIYKSYKKPKILREIKEESISIVDKSKKDELGTQIGNEVEDEINIRITEIFVKFLKNRTSPICILRKYLSIWHRNAQYMPLIDNAKIIANFCKSKFDDILIRKKWRKLYEKYLITEKQYNIIKILKGIRKRRYKLIRLIRMTRLMTVFNRRKFLHYIIMYWLIYSISTVKKRNQIKLLYENMLSTYISMADDIFGRNQKNNPSVQDCMFEIIDSDKYQVKELEDVPIAKSYYSKKGEEKKTITNIKYVKKEKNYTFYKEIDKKEIVKPKNNKNEMDNNRDDKKNSYSYKRVYNVDKSKKYSKKINLNNKDNQKEDSKNGKGKNSNKIYKTETNRHTSVNSDNNIFKDRTKYGKGKYTFKGLRTETNVDNKDNNNDQSGKYLHTNYSYQKYHKTDIDNKNTFYNNINSQGETNYGKEYYNSEGYNRTESNIDEDISNVDNNNNNSQGGKKYVGKKYNYRGYNKTDINENNNIDNNQVETKYGKTNYSFRTYNKTETSDKNNNNRYINTNIDDYSSDNQKKDYNCQRKYNNNFYYKSSDNNIGKKEQKQDEKIKGDYKSDYKSHFKNRINNYEINNKIIPTTSNKKYNYNNKSDNYSTNKIEPKLSYTRFHINKNKYKIDEGK